MKTQFALILSLVAVTLLPSLPESHALAAQQTSTDGVFFLRSLNRLKVDGEVRFPFRNYEGRRYSRFWANARFAYVALDQSGEAFLQLDVISGRRPGLPTVVDESGDLDDDSYRGPKLAIRLDTPADVTGTIYIPEDWNSQLKAFHFSIKADQFTASRKEFLRTKYAHYQRLWNSQLTGAAWFRYQASELARQLGQRKTVSGDARRQTWARQNESELERSLSLISGGMALSENLQLDRMLNIGAAEDNESFDVDEIKGITVTEFDWKPLVKDIDPDLDALAGYIPSDQHAMFVPSFQALVTLIETGFEVAGPLFPLISDTSESANTRQRYQDQLGLPLGEVQKLFGPKLIDSIAITGGDPYFRTGTDVAVLFETREPAALITAIEATIAMSTRNIAGVEKAAGTVGRVAYNGVQTADRRFCSYVASLGNVVLVTNSTEQLSRIVAVGNQEQSSLATLDEYHFFRNRYKLGDQQETALVIISDETIRRWCSPRWRIATSRRTRAAAILADLHARYLPQLADGMDSPVNVDIGPSVFSLNQYKLIDHAAISSDYGTLAFQTPVGELEIDKVSRRERQAYQAWRRGYQSNWSTAFDPIAIRLNMADGKLAADMTVMPLIDNSEYDSMTDVSLGAQLNPKRNSRHSQALAWAALALNTDSPLLKQWANIGSTFARVNFMDWLGDAAVVYVDEDPLWSELEKQAAEGIDQAEFFESNVHRLPVAIQFNVKSGIRLTAFLVGLRGFIEQSAPDMAAWETLRHREKAYVKVGPTANARNDLPDDVDADIALYYFASGDTLIFSLSELVIQHAIDRRIDAESDQSSGNRAGTESLPPKSLPLLGKNLAVQIKRSLAIGVLAFLNDDYQRRMQRQAWSALPILNEWKRMFPDRDPLDIDRIVWKRELVCPGGGEYRWNAESKTMESSVYGHPADPKPGPHVAQLLGDWEAGNFGLTFENQGLRARLDLTVAPK